MNKISYYNNLINSYDNNEENTNNFLKGILLYIINIELFYTFLYILEKKYKYKINIFPSFKYDEEGETKENKMELLLFNIKDENNSAVCKKLKKDISIIENNYGKASCNFNYNKKDNLICLELNNIEKVNIVEN